MPIYTFINKKTNEKVEELFKQSYDTLVREGVFEIDEKSKEVVYLKDGIKLILVISSVGKAKLIGSGFYENDY